MSRFNERLNEETNKFKLEIEADSLGCTARLEERANEEMLPFIKLEPLLSSLSPSQQWLVSCLDFDDRSMQTR